MSCTVFRTTMGLFSLNSGGQGVAPLDVCLTAPTPPAGPVPVPYVNLTFAKDLEKGTVTVKADKGIVAIQSDGKVAKSNGDEPGNIMTKGVASMTNTGAATFATWSFTVLMEGQGTCAMGDLMNQNCNGTILNCLDPAAIVQFAAALAQLDMLKPCDKPYDGSQRPPKNQDPSAEQTEAVDGKACWECNRDTGTTTPLYNTTTDENGNVVENPKRKKMARQREGKTGGKEAMTHDHQPPIGIAWNMGGCHMGEDKFKELFAKKEMVKPHCRAHACSQGGTVSAVKNQLVPQG